MLVVMFDINENIPCKSLSPEEVPNNWKIIFIEFSIKTQKWLCIGRYKLLPKSGEYFLDKLSFILNKLTGKCDNIMLMGDFNLTVENNNLEVYFMSAFDLECMIKKLHVSNLLILNYIDLILNNKK